MILKEMLLEVLCTPDKSPKKLTEHCRRIAVAYLKMKVSSGNSFITSLGASLDDLALDCIADLFERDEQGEYIHFHNYFDKNQLFELSEPNLHSQLRRLVFSKVNDGVFRNIGIYDLSLSKIIRNLKLAADKHGLLIARENGDNILFFDVDTSFSSHKLLMPPEFLEIKLTHRLHLTMETPEILANVTDIFRNQTEYDKRYPVVQLAQIIRRSTINLHDQPKTYYKRPGTLVSKNTLNALLNEAVKECTDCFEKTYISKGKIDRTMLDRYLDCIKKILHHHYITDSETGDSYYNHFKKQFPDVTKEEYRREHRQYLEYMVKRVRSDLFQKVKRVI